MKTLARAIIGIVLLHASPALAQITFEWSTPVIRFEVPPPLVVVSPGVQVVEDYDNEVFFVDRAYWVRYDGSWYRSADHRGRWVVVEPRYVPMSVRRLPPGHYRKFKGGHHHYAERGDRDHARWESRDGDRHREGKRGYDRRDDRHGRDRDQARWERRGVDGRRDGKHREAKHRDDKHGHKKHGRGHNKH